MKQNSYDDYIASENDILLERKIQEMQSILDAGWSRSRHSRKYINGHPVSDEEYEIYQEQKRIENAKLEAEISFYRKCTSTGEEWEIDSDGIEYIPF